MKLFHDELIYCECHEKTQECGCKKFEKGVMRLTKTKRTFASKQIAFIIIMSALANILGAPPFIISLGAVNIHFLQLPILLTGLALGAVAGGIVGFIGPTVMAFTFRTPNLFILPGNALLGFFTGLFYSRLRRIRPPILPQLLALIGAVAIQFVYTYFSDVYGASIPSANLVFPILPTLFIEDIISLVIAHVILFRTDINQILRK
jgi:uncharacterized membrane protein